MPGASGRDRASWSTFDTTRCTPLAARGEGLAEAWPGSVRTRESVVDVDVLFLDFESHECVALDGQILLNGGDTCVRDQHGADVAFDTPSPGRFADGSNGNGRD